jgi:hypothetical protein
MPPKLTPLSCTRCGAPITEPPVDDVIRCAYCKQAHVLEVPLPAPPPAAPAARHGTSLVWLVAGGVLVASLAIVLAVRLTSSGPAPAASVGTGAGADGPGDASLSYSTGQLVDVYWGSSWWPGRIKRDNGAGSYRIGYDGYASSWDEDVTARRLRRRSSAPALAVAPANADPSARYVEGEPVDIFWGSRWWPGKVVSVPSEGRYHVSYDGWSASYDETVDATRLRRR